MISVGVWGTVVIGLPWAPQMRLARPLLPEQALYVSP